MNVLEKLGIKKEKKSNFAQTLFYFMRELHVNPLDEEYILPNGSVVIKKGISIPLFNSLLEEMGNHYEREKQEYERNKRRR